MQAKVVRLWRDGKQVPRWQLGTLKEVSGDLIMEASNDEHLRRFLRSARLLDITKRETGELDALPPLHDAAVLWIKENRMTITGFERDQRLEGEIAYAQTWLVEILVRPAD